MHGDDLPYGYGFWLMVIVNAGFFVFFVLSYLVPLRRREWRSFGVYTAFIVALFTEMYGFPLTIYVLSSVLGSRYPVLNPFSHANGHLWVALLGGGAVMMNVIHVVSNGLMVLGLLVIALAWGQVHRAQGAPVTTGLYERVRHPQYSGLWLISVGLLIQWPTIITLLTWPILIGMYVRLALREEREMDEAFGDAYRTYAARVPRFIPRVHGRRRSGGGGGQEAAPALPAVRSPGDEVAEWQ